MPLNQREQKVAILCVRARTYEDAAREIRSAAKTGYDLADAEKIASMWESRAKQLREETEPYGVMENTTVADLVRTFALPAERASTRR